ncbi:MAG TPA: histidine--tRNA ligase [Chitinophagaceae bacterium]|nr:histidine--tRNA ligase [Chitinophagaceae bacterium]
MAKVNVGIPQGTRDFGADAVRKRNYIFDTIRNVFELYGFQPLETPAMENLETLMGKYGEEGDKLIFKILNNGLDNASKQKQAREDFEKLLKGKNVAGITERALKYDLTIPFARYVAMNHGQLTFPFKRYQIQPVWRADRPQKGRYREFYQCDADIVGSTSLLNEAELANVYADVFAQLKIPVEIKINNRKILLALAEKSGGIEKMADITGAIDKLDKIGLQKVKEELSQRGLTTKQVALVDNYLSISGNNEEKIAKAKQVLGGIPSAENGLAELEEMLEYPLTTPSAAVDLPKARHDSLPTSIGITVDFTLARGLNYYTGVIFEVKAQGVQIGSIGGGGRYDDLTGLFGVPNIPGVGISFGVDRIYDVMEQLTLFPTNVYTGAQVLFFNLGENECKVALRAAQQLRRKNIRCEIYHEPAKFDKQFRYAEKKKIPFVAIIGEEEIKNNSCKIKNLNTGQQVELKIDELTQFSFS